MNAWKPNIKNWDKIPLESYKLIFSQTKDRFEEVSSESESITNKSIKILSFLVLIGSSILGYGIDKKANSFLLLTYVFVFIAALCYVVALLFPKQTIGRGSRPQEVNWHDYDEQQNSESDKIALTYFQEICRKGDSIDRMVQYNSGRQEMYRIAIILTTILFISGILIVLT